MFVTDEALYIYIAGGKGVRLVETVPWDAERFEQNVARILSKDCGGRPVTILNDMVEQHYRKERVLKAGGVMDKAGMLRRKLNVAFPNYPVKAALPLKEKPSADQKGPADIYIFAAVPDTKQFSSTMSAANISMVPVAGFCLLPVESSDLVKNLSAKLHRKGEPKSQWVLFIGQHKNGSLRQIVTKNGELALTRMTPIVDNDNDVDVWVGDVHNEFKATMSYLARFGYQTEDGLHVVVISNSAAGAALEKRIEEPCKYSSLTATEAAKLMGLSLGMQDEPRYADPLHAAWVARKSKFILPMKATQIDKVSKPRQMALAASVLLFCGMAFLGYQLFNQLAGLATLREDIATATDKLARANTDYQEEVKKKEALGFDVRLVQSSIAVFDRMESESIEALVMFSNIGAATGKDLRYDRIIIDTPQLAQILPSVDQPAGGLSVLRAFEAKLQMTYPSTTDIDKGNLEVAELGARLKRALPAYDVAVTKYLKDYEYVQEVVVETGDLEKKDVSQDFVAEITIRPPAETPQEGVVQ